MKATVKVLIFDQWGRILSVREKGDGAFGKRAGWGLPGGGVEANESIEGIYREIIQLLRAHCLFKDELLIYVPKDNPYTLAAIRETLEETGFLVRIEKEILREHSLDTDHILILYKAKIIDGELKKESSETDDSGWFYHDSLPEVDENLDLSNSIFPSDKRRIGEAVKILGIKEDLEHLKWLNS